MKLDTFHGKLLMPQSHDCPRTIFLYRRGTDFQVWGQTIFRDYQRVISGRGHRRGQSAKNSSSIVQHQAGLSMHKIWSSHHLSTKSSANRLMSQTDSEHRHLACEMPD